METKEGALSVYLASSTELGDIALDSSPYFPLPCHCPFPRRPTIIELVDGTAGWPLVSSVFPYLRAKSNTTYIQEERIQGKHLPAPNLWSTDQQVKNVSKSSSVVSCHFLALFLSLPPDESMVTFRCIHFTSTARQGFVYY